VSWAQVLEVFLRAAFLSANGSTTLALLQEDLVQRLRVLSPRDFSTGVAVGCSTPGPLGYGCIALGFLADGWRGALVAVFTSWLPPLLSIPLRNLYTHWEDRAWIAGVTWGIGAAGTGLLAALALSLAVQTAVAGWADFALSGIVLALLLSGRVPLVGVIGLAAVAGAAFLR
jgi:chromate transporter